MRMHVVRQHDVMHTCASIVLTAQAMLSHVGT